MGALPRTLDGILQGVFSGTIRTIEDLLKSLQQTFLEHRQQDCLRKTAVRFASALWLVALSAGGAGAGGPGGHRGAAACQWRVFLVAGREPPGWARPGVAGRRTLWRAAAAAGLGAGALGITGGQLINVGIGQTSTSRQLGASGRGPDWRDRRRHRGQRRAVIGTAIGYRYRGLAGLRLGGVLGGVLGPRKRQPELTLQGAIAPRFGFNPVTGFSHWGRLWYWVA